MGPSCTTVQRRRDCSIFYQLAASRLSHPSRAAHSFVRSFAFEAEQPIVNIQKETRREKHCEKGQSGGRGVAATSVVLCTHVLLGVAYLHGTHGPSCRLPPARGGMDLGPARHFSKKVISPSTDRLRLVPPSSLFALAGLLHVGTRPRKRQPR